jgi:pyruvate-formate lyase-activating enzyme
MSETNRKPLPVREESKVFCVLPWIHLCASVDGVWGRCCVDNAMYHDHYYQQEAEPEFKLNEEALGCMRQTRYAGANPARTYNLLEAFNSPALRRTRRAMLADERVNACGYCYEREDGGAVSYRQIANAMFPELDLARLIEATLPDGTLHEFPLYLDLRFGNTCNLECIMCAFPVSSRWARHAARWATAKIDPYATDDELWKILEQNASKIRRIYFAGGEPFLQPMHFRMLELLIDSGCAGDVDLGYNTNLTVLPQGIFEKLKLFKSVDLGASCDGTGAVFERIRVGARWETFVRNVREAKRHFPVRLAVTPQRDNLANLEELIEWGLAEGLEIDLSNVLVYPEEFSIARLGPEQKGHFTRALGELSDIHRRAGREEIAAGLDKIISFMNTDAAPGVP